MALDLVAVLHLSRELQRATTLGGLVEAAQDAVRSATGYSTTWLGVFDPGPPRTGRALAIRGGSVEALVWELAPVFPVDSDPMMAEVWESSHPVVVVDARTDPRTDKRQVEVFGNRTLIHVPLLLGDLRIGSLSTGTFAPDGARPPTTDQLETLVVFAALVAAALLRVRVQEEQEKLRRQVAAAQRLESIAVLAGGVAHDFNNLLSVILASSSLLAEEPLSTPQRQELDGIVDAAVRAQKLTTQLLALGRRQELRPEPIDLTARLSQLTGLLRRMLPPAIALRVEVPERLPQVMVDPNQLDQVLVNLCINARDAMPGGGSLTLKVATPPLPAELRVQHPGLASRPCVQLSVVDTGKGMSPEVLARVFEPFFTTKAAGVGTGLGLSVAAAIVEQHGGHLRCSSVPGAGTTFDIWLPAAAETAGECAAAGAGG